MSYIDGYLLPLPQGKEERYLEVARSMSAMCKEYGATRIVEAIEDDFNPGKQNDFHTAVLAKDGERTVFSWVEWPDKETRDAGWAKMKEDPRMEPPSDMPFDGMRMIYGGFKPLLDE